MNRIIESIVNNLNYLYEEQQEENRLRIKYQEAIARIAHYDIENMDDAKDCQKIARIALE